MRNGITDLLFDLDDTLWDCAGNSVISLRQIYDLHELAKHFYSFASFNNIYQHINDELWAALPDSNMTVADVRTERFVKTLEAAGIHSAELGERLNEDYMHLMVKCPGTMPYAAEVLKELSQHYRISIVTNGIADVQRGKLAASGLDEYTYDVFVSDEIGAMKPKKEYFDRVMKRLDRSKASCIVIGDNAMTDIKGATDFGLAAIWYNWKGASETMSCGAEIIDDLRVLLNIL
ncbi:MAG: YjjG family noncanonical pyrimidine nucleotidase [Marinilabiliaceae bacterium]